MNLPETIEELSRMPDFVLAAVIAVGRDGVRFKLSPGDFSLLEHACADAAKHIVGGLALQNDVVDPAAVKQLPQQQSRRPRAND